MNGSRSAHPRHGDRDRSSLDALSRTIEGLEARIQGLMAGAGRPPAPTADPRSTSPAQPDVRAPRNAAPAPAPYTERPRDPLAEIRERQRMLEEAANSTRHHDAPRSPERYAAQPSPRSAEPRAERSPARNEARPEMRHATPTRREDIRQPAVSTRVAEANQRRADMREFTDALTGLRRDLKRDLTEGFSDDMRALREEVRAIKLQAEDRRFAKDVQSDIARLSQSIDQLTTQPTPEAADLRSELEDLRSAIEGLAREDSLRQIQDQWQGLEERMQEADSAALREELVSVAYRIDEMRNQLGLMADSPVIRALEQKLLAVAGMMEQLGSRMQPDDRAFTEQFGQLDQRLDEISRAIAANTRAPANAHDERAMQRLESGFSVLLKQVETIGRSASDNSMTDALSSRIEALTGKIDELAEDQAAARLEERIEQLAALVQQLQPHGQQEEFTGYLSDISRKIDALDTSFGAEGFGERLDEIARRIEEMEQPQRGQDPADEAAFVRIEDRLTDIAARLDEASSAPRGNDDALRALEAQIANLSSLMAQPSAPAALPAEFDSRMAAIEGYMATNDEYIVEAARRAAEAVVEAYSRNMTPGTPGASADVAALSALTDDLKHLEELARGSESRTHQTFEALHGTLVQIADRLDHLESHVAGATAFGMRAEEPAAKASFGTAAPVYREMETAAVAAPMAAPVLSADVAHELASLDVARDENRMAEARLKETSAIGSTMADHIPAAAAPVTEDEPKTTKTSLLGGLARRFRRGENRDAAQSGRTLVDPTPSIDPSVDGDIVDTSEDLSDVLPPERANELLEPGSGAPDVKKILERVRASQAAGEFASDRSADKTGDRADYIAAARRAAKAAAQEADPSQMGSLPKAKAKFASAKDAPSGSAFSRHRRPILMAVGAVLLALMAMPLIKTVTGGQQAPEIAANAPSTEMTAPAEPATDMPQQDMSSASMVRPPVSEAPQDSVAPPVEPQPPANTSDTSDQSGSLAPEANALVEAAPQMNAAAPAIEPPVSETASASPSAAETAAAIEIPVGIEPKSLADAAAGGDANALFEIGARYSDGRGVATDLSEAAKWYRLAADRGLPPAQYRMGNLLEKGTGVERNLGEAVSWYKQAAEAGNASAMHNLAVLLASGATGRPDYAGAIEWFRSAAELGVADSQFNLAILYARGNGVSQNLEESYKWFGVAAKGGDSDAAAKRDEVANAMRKEQLDSARAKLDSWSAKPLDPRANAVAMPDEWAGGKGVTTASVDMDKAIRNIQAILNRNGFDAGTPDGKMGARTIAAIKSFQTSVGQEPTGQVDDAMVKELLARNK